MALSMHTNYASMVTQNNLNKTSNLMNKAMERLSTGYRINSAADDAAGLQIANRLEMSSRGMSVAMRNSQDGISMLQTAEGAFDEATNILHRMNDLATQSSNGTNSTADQAAMDKEFTALKTELGNIIDNTKYAGEALITADGIKTGGGVELQIGAESSQKLDLAGDVDDSVKAAHGSLKTDVAALTITDATTSAAAMDGLKTALDTVGTARASLGATINRLDHNITNLGNMVENTSAAKGRITDADFAVESSNMTKNQMLMQAGTTVLARTNQMPSMAMSLIG